jgi:hypothetical protein
LDDVQSRGFVSHARLLHPELAVDPRSVEICPAIFQAYVDKIADLRVTVIGEQQFVMQLDSVRGHAFVDWRSHTSEAEFRVQTQQLDTSIHNKISHLMKQLGLVYGCVDLVVDRAQQVHFLEVNQAGQFLFAERWAPALPLLRAMTAMLATGRVDYRLDDVAGLSYQEYLDSDCYQQWVQDCEIHGDNELANEPFLSVEANV